MQSLQAQILRFVFTEMAARHSAQWLGASRGSVSLDSGDVADQLGEWIEVDERTRRRLAGIGSIRGLLESYLLKSVRLDSHMGLWGLASGRYPLILRTDIPTARAMLDRQCLGERYVTYLCGPDDRHRPVGRFKGSFEFLMHDLEHAHKFFGEPELFRAQVRFFNLLRAILPRLAPWRDDPLFEKDLNYLMSDMNSHPVHLFKYLKAIVLTASLRSAGGDDGLADFWDQVFADWRAGDDFRASAGRINRPGLETPADQTAVLNFFRR